MGTRYSSLKCFGKADVNALIELLEKDALNVPGLTDTAGAVPEDPEDDMFLACACDAEADVIVSGDRHLLQLGSFRGIPVVTVRGFVERFLGVAL